MKFTGKTPVKGKGETVGGFEKNLQIKLLRSEPMKERKKEERLGGKNFTLQGTSQTDLDKGRLCRLILPSCSLIGWE